MSINRQRKHVIFFGEDEATRNLAQGFCESEKINDLKCEVWSTYGTGWQSTIDAIETVRMSRYPQTHLVLVIDLDRRGEDRIAALKREIANCPCKDRVYIIGCTKDVQALQRSFTPVNSIGKLSAQETGRTIADRSSKDVSCMEGVWGDSSLVHNKDELERLCRNLKDVIFV